MNTRIHIAATLVALMFCGLAQAQEAQADPFTAIITWKVENDRDIPATIETRIREAGPAQYRAIETRLLAALTAPNATPDAKIFICRQLIVVGSPACIPAVAPLLLDEKTSHPARMALEVIQAPAAGAALRSALPQTRGALRVGVISSIGARRDAQAVEVLARLVGDTDQDVAGAAINALGAIGTAESARALAAARPAEALGRALLTARLTAAQNLAADGKTADAVPIFRSLADARQPKAVRIGATRGLIGALPRTEAVRLTVATLQGDAALRSAALAALQEPSEKALRDALAEQVPTLAPEAQLAVLDVLAVQDDVALRGALLQVLQQSKNQPVRSAAIEALATHGLAGDIPLLITLARGTDPEAAVAKRTLERLGKSGSDEALIAALEKGDAPTRSVVLGVLATRRTESALPLLAKLVVGSDPAVAADAAKALGMIGGAGQVPALAEAIVKTSSDAHRAEAENAIKAICARTADRTPCAAAVLAAMPQAQGPARLALVRLLPSVRGEQALATARQAMGDANAELAEAATRALFDWPDTSAGPAILEVAKSPKSPSHGILAIRAYLRLARDAKDQPIAQRVAMYATALEIAQRGEEKSQAIAGLADLPSVDALELIQKQLKDEGLRAAAAQAILRLAPQLAAIDNQRAKAALTAVKDVATNDDIRQKVDAALKVVDNAGQSDGYIIGWLVSGPFREADKDAAGLFDVVFPPERANAQVDWRPVMAPTQTQGPRLIHLDSILGGNNCVAYLRTQLVSEKDQEVLLEIGSDDGVKVWLNGKVIHTNNTTRGNTPGQDKVKANLSKGVNILLVKVTQGGGEWSAVVRLRSAGGGEADGVLVAPAAK